MEEPELIKKYYSKAAALCSKSEKCEDDVKQKLFEWKVEHEIIPIIIQKLVAEKFIDNQRYCEFYVKDKFRINKWGKIKIGAYLKQKKMNNSIINEAFTQIKDGEYEDCILNLLKKKKSTLKNEEPNLQKTKLIRFGISRGFETDIIIKCLNIFIL